MTELVGALGIDWKILVAQAINFAILVFVLRYFLYKPLLSLLKKRQADIAEMKQNEEAARIRLDEIEAEKEKILAAARKRSDELLAETEKRGKELEERLSREAIKNKDAILAQGKAELALAREQLLQDVRAEARLLLKSALERGFSDVLDKPASEKLVDEAVRIMQASVR